MCREKLEHGECCCSDSVGRTVSLFGGAGRWFCVVQYHIKLLSVALCVWLLIVFFPLSSDVHRLYPGGGEPLPAAPRPLRPARRGEVQRPPLGRDLAAHLCDRQRVLPLAVEEAAQPVCPHQVGDSVDNLSIVFRPNGFQQVFKPQ